MTETLDARLQNTVAHLQTIAPPELFAVFGAEQQRLAATDDAAGRIAVGDVLPSATLPDALGRAVTLPAGPTVVVFYRGAWCPYCNVALAAYQAEVLPVAREVGAQLVAVSPQAPDGSLTIAEKNGLEFPVLTDAASAYARSLGLVFDLTSEVQDAQLALGNDFTAINAGSDWSLPKPTVIVTDVEGIVRFVDTRPDYTQRTEPAAIVNALRAWT
jgi:peroxiredoxin